LARPTRIAVRLADMQVRMVDENTAQVRLIQTYESNLLNETIRKTLVLALYRDKGRWLIREEVSGGPAPEPRGGAKAEPKAEPKADSKAGAKADAPSSRPVLPVSPSASASAGAPAATAGAPSSEASSATAAATPSAPSVPAAPALPNANESARRAIEDAVITWAGAWMKKDVNAYFESYAADFSPQAMTRAAWAAQRRERLGRAGDITIRLGELSIRMLGDTRASVSFSQNYQSTSLKETGRKTLMMVQGDTGKWLIREETFSK
jgi:ketosteroid isomerase-like protein